MTPRNSALPQALDTHFGHRESGSSAGLGLSSNRLHRVTRLPAVGSVTHKEFGTSEELHTSSIHLHCVMLCVAPVTSGNSAPPQPLELCCVSLRQTSGRRLRRYLTMSKTPSPCRSYRHSLQHGEHFCLQHSCSSPSHLPLHLAIA
jgi:hypothetical protein